MDSDKLIIDKSSGCSGSIQISGAKNAALPQMAACLLTNEKVTLRNVPEISDVATMKKQLKSYGVRVEKRDSELILQASSNTKSSPSGGDGANTRGSFLVLGPLLARFREATVYYPGGCQIGSNGRPVNYHLDALKKMGAKVERSDNYVSLKADNGLVGENIHFPKISVGATENVVMAACLADGETEITNAAVEPEVIDLIQMLKAMGMEGKIHVEEKKNKIVIQGRGSAFLKGCVHTVIPDRIEAGTWAIATAVTGGQVLLKMNPEVGQKIMFPVVRNLKKAGVEMGWQRNGLEVQMQRNGIITPVSVTAGPFPEFPTDLLPQWVTLMTLASGPSTLKDTIYDKRFQHVEYLNRMGAKITRLADNEYRVHGNAKLVGNRVIATDLRAGVALILAGLAAEGSTVVKEIHHVLRGYENLTEKLRCWNTRVQKLPQARSGFHGGDHQRR